MKEDPRHIHISEYSYPLPDERIAKFPLPTRDQSKLLIYRRGEVSEDVFTSLPEYLPQGSLMIFNNTKVIQARLHFRKETGALIEVFCLEPIQPNDYVLNFQQTAHAAWLCMIGNLKKWKDGQLKREMTVKGFPITLTATRGECKGTSHWVDFAWDNPEVTFADILEVFGELPIPPYLNRDTEESDKETYQTVYSKIKGSVAAPTAGLHFTPRVLDALQEEGIDLEGELRGVGAPLHIGQIEGVERGVRIGREPDVHAAEGLDEISVLASGVEDDDLVLRIGEHCIGDLAFHREGLPGTGLAADEPHGTCELLAVADNEVARLLRLPVIAPALLVEL